MPGKDVKRVLLRAPNWIGDAVMSLPAAEALKVLYPKARITVLAKRRVIPVYQNNPCVNEIIEYEDKARHKGLKGRFALSGELKEKDFDLAVLFQNAFDAAFIAFISRIPGRVGYARDLRSRLLTLPVPVTEEIKKKHQVFYYLNIINALGGKSPKKPVPKIHIGKAETAWAASFIKDNGIAGKPLIGVAPGASYGPAKRWTDEGFAGALNKFSDKGFVPIIFGGPEDSPACDAVARRLKGAHLNLAGKTTLRQSMALLKELKVFITNDSGPMHISAALGVPTVAVFGSTEPELTGPLGKAVKVMIKKTECSPCFERECKYKHYKCLTSITDAEVIREAAAFLKRYEHGQGKT